MKSVPSFEIARHISPSSTGLVFGLNTFLALGFQTILTTIVADSAGLALEPRPQVGCKYFLSSLDIFSVVPSVRGVLPGDGVRLPRAGAGWAGQGRGQAGGVAQGPAGHCTERLRKYNVKGRDPLGSKKNIFILIMSGTFLCNFISITSDIL